MNQRATRIYGRDPDLAQLRAVPSNRREIVVLRGPSGIGKSELLRTFYSELLTANDNTICLLHSIEAPAQSLNFLIDDLASQLLSSPVLPRLDLSTLARAVVTVARDSTWSVASAALLNVVDRVIPGSRETLRSLREQVAREVAQVAPPAMIEKLQNALPQDMLAGFLNIISALNNAGVHGIILIDQAEAASDSVREALLGISVQLPSGWSILLAINDELPEGIEFYEKTWPRLAYKGARQIVLKPLGVDALERWCLIEKGDAPGRLELESVIENCQGRPLLLRDWVSGLSDEAEIIAIWQRLGPYYQNRLNSLTPTAKALVRALSLLPASSAFSLELIKKIADVHSNTAAFEIVEELVRAQFLEAAAQNENYRFVHDITKRQVTVNTPLSVLRESAMKVVMALKQTQLDASLRPDTQRGYTLAVLEHQAGLYQEFLSDALPVAADLVSEGSYTSAIELYRACLSLEGTAMVRQAEIEAKIGLATALHATGYYHEGLNFLTMAETWPQLQKANALLARGKLLLRLDRYPEARSTLYQARGVYAELNSPKGVMQCDKEEITVLRDLGYYSEAVRKSYDLVRRAEDQAESKDLLGSCYRALARSLAFTGPRERAVAAGEHALELALDSGSTTNVGNANLALGEAYRLGGVPADAVSFYEVAAQIGLTVGNKDSYMWAVLGMSDCHFLLRDFNTARQVLVPLGDILRSRPDQHPLEYLHWRLSELTISLFEGADVRDELVQIVAEYGRLGVTWPQEYLSSVMSEGSLSPKRF